MDARTELRLWKLGLIDTIMSDEFEEWMKEYWYILKETEELEQFLDLYIRRTNSPYYFDKPEDYKDPFEVKRHAPITPAPDYKWD